MRKYFPLFLLLVCLLISGVVTQGDFFSARNITNLMRQISINGILSLGMTFIILTGGIDLSIGSVVALASVVAGILQVNHGYDQTGTSGAFITIAAAIGVGTLAGIFNGAFIVKSKVVPFIITLGAMVMARGGALIISNGAAIAPLGESYNFLGQGYFDPTYSCAVIAIVCLITVAWSITARNIFILVTSLVSSAALIYSFYVYKGAPVPVMLFGALAFFTHYILQHTIYGRYVVALGSNPDAAMLSGVPIDKIKLSVYIFMGALAGLSGAVLSARLNGAMPTSGELFELDAIAAVVIGGTRLSGGAGSIGGSVIGALLIGVINNAMSLLNITEFYQKVIKGMIIIAAVWLDTKARHQNSKNS